LIIKLLTPTRILRLRHGGDIIDLNAIRESSKQNEVTVKRDRDGIPVTEETYFEWWNEFKKELDVLKPKNIKLSELTGRDFFRQKYNDDVNNDVDEVDEVDDDLNGEIEEAHFDAVDWDLIEEDFDEDLELSSD